MKLQSLNTRKKDAKTAWIWLYDDEDNLIINVFVDLRGTDLHGEGKAEIYTNLPVFVNPKKVWKGSK